MFKPASRLHALQLSLWPLCLVLILGPLGCTRLKVHSSPFDASLPTQNGEARHPADAAGVSFVTYRYEGDARRQDVYGGEVLVQLWLDRNGRKELVHRGTDSSWSRLDLIPGDYVLEVVEIYEGDRTVRPNEDSVISFKLEAGRTAQVNLVLKEVPWGTVAIATFAVVVVIGLVVAVVLLDQKPPRGDALRTSRTVRGSPSSFGLPPPPRVAAPIPPRSHFHWVGPPRAYIGLHLVLAELGPPVVWVPDYYLASPVTGPRVLRFTLPDPENVAGSVRVTFDREMEPFYFDPSTLQLWNDEGIQVAGGVYYDPMSRQAVFRPLRPLEEGAYRVLLYGELLYDLEGRSVGQTFEQHFFIGKPATLERTLEPVENLPPESEPPQIGDGPPSPQP